MPTYTQLEYPLDEFGETDYPQKLCNYLAKRFFSHRDLSGITSLLDIGAGKGSYVLGFQRCGLYAIGADRDASELTICCNIERTPFTDNEFDYIFSKSTLEHCPDTQKVLKEAYRVLKPYGLVVFLVPDWLSQWKIFYNDSTHIKPFTKKGLTQAFLLAGFTEVQCEVFCTLTFSWNQWLKWIPPLVSLLPYWTRYRIIRFSKEKMLLLSARKPSML